MATAVEMTIALGRTLYGAPQSNTDNTSENETIEGCETRVSVTWRLAESEQNLPLTASLLAEKTVQVLETADCTIQCKKEQPVALQPASAQNPPPALLASTPGVNGATAAPPPNGANGNGTVSRSYTTAFVPKITKAQSLAIQSLCTRHNVADWELRRLLWEQFSKKEQSDLTKDQAGELLNILQQNAAHDEAHDHAYA